MINTVDRLYELMELNGFSLCRLCQEAEINHSTISAARKRHGQLSLDTIDRVCRVLNISVSAFFAEDEAS